MSDGHSEPSWSVLAEIAAAHGEAFYLVDPDRLTEAVTAVRAGFATHLADVDTAFCYKANPTPELCAQALRLGMASELASGFELDLARHLGVPPVRTILGGVGRGPDIVHSALAAGATVVVDGDRDVAMVVDYAAQGWAESPARVLLRVRIPTPGAPAPRLGMTPEHAIEAGRLLAATPGVELLGVHCHVIDRSQVAMATTVAALAEVAAELLPDGPRILDLGGAVPRYDPARGAALYEPYAKVIAAELTSRGWLDTRIVLEVGSAVAMTTTNLVARVIDVRSQPGRTVATVAASVLHSSPNTRRADFPVRLVPDPHQDRPPAHDPVFLAGATPIDGDWLALDLPWSVAPGDFVELQGVGAYSIGFDTGFVEAPLPVVIRGGGQWRTGRRPWTFAERYAGVVFP